MPPITDGGSDSGKSRPSWLTVLGRILLPVGLLAIALLGAAPNLAKAATGSQNSYQNTPQGNGWGAGGPNGKIAPDLWAALGSGNVPKARWAANTSHGLYVQVVITATSPDPMLQNVRSTVLAVGGSVYYMYQSVPAILAVLPGSAVSQVAGLGEVDAIVPNRVAYRTASYLQQTTGASSAPQVKTGVSYDGTSIGIAILDSGIDACYAAFGASLQGKSSTCSSKGVSIQQKADFTRLSAGLQP